MLIDNFGKNLKTGFLLIVWLLKVIIWFGLKLIKRKPVLWDNLHANDYDLQKLYLGPYTGIKNCSQTFEQRRPPKLCLLS